MNFGLRKHKEASCRIVEPAGLPEELRAGTRELVDLASSNPRKGHATGLLHQVCTEADVSGMVLILMPSPFADGMTQEQLEKWYSRFGFALIQSEPAKLMARAPHMRRARLAVVH